MTDKPRDMEYYSDLMRRVDVSLMSYRKPGGRWSHRAPLDLLQEVRAELVASRDALRGRGWEHLADTRARVARTLSEIQSIGSRIEEYGYEIEGAVEELINPTDKSGRSAPDKLNELMDLINQHHLEEHDNTFRFCNQGICKEAQKLTDYFKTHQQ